jgi:hypothetical protein
MEKREWINFSVHEPTAEADPSFSFVNYKYILSFSEKFKTPIKRQFKDNSVEQEMHRVNGKKLRNNRPRPGGNWTIPYR